jgi:hypothetical protein
MRGHAKDLMSTNAHDLPMRRTAAGEQIETRPLHVEEWLDSLPYVDFRKTGRLLVEATRATNAQSIKAVNRLELVALYHRPYQYYVESQIRAGAQHTLQSIETVQEQVEVLKQIGVNLALACKLAAEETLKQKTLWGQTKPPLPALLSSLNYLSHALIFSFLEYSPTPKNVWRELHFVYEFATGLGRENETVLPVGGAPDKDATSIAAAWKRIVMASLADPHHLPFGAIWEIYEQLNDWVGHVTVERFEPSGSPGGHFVVDLGGDGRPVPLATFRPEGPLDRHRLLDASALGGIIEELLERLSTGQSPGTGIRLSPFFAKSVLAHVLRAWGLPPKRSAPREPRQGRLSLTCGLGGAYYFVNGEREFVRPRTEEEEDEMHAGLREVTPPGSYVADVWEMVDEGPGGFAVIKTERPRYSVRVGDLVGIGESAGPERKWSLGIIRWMMVRQGKGYRIGVQIISHAAAAVAVRAVSGSEQDRRYRRALMFTHAEDAGRCCMITDRGLFLGERPLELKENGTVRRVVCGALTESAVGFDYFTLLPDRDT